MDPDNWEEMQLPPKSVVSIHEVIRQKNGDSIERTVASYFGGQKAFTVGFEGGEHYDESRFAAELAEKLDIEHFVHIIPPEEY